MGILNETHKAVIRKYWIMLGALAVMQTVLIIVVIKFTTALMIDAKPEQLKNVKNVVAVVLTLFLAFLDVLFIYNKILRLYRAFGKKPKHCIIIDFLTISFSDEGKRRYAVYPLVKENTSGNYYFSFGNHSLSWYTTIRSQANNTLGSIAILRGDGNNVEPGKPADIYIIKLISQSATYDPENSILSIENKHVKAMCSCVEAYEIEKLNKITIFEGVVDVDC